ncbi:YihY/virulence factor BrkB family protein [Mycolicibacterium gilvum]|uniref:Predicted membrane protein n=1 Tax=Mycolicibacterium gilvum (strain DSM 45189 / LMG 24558 / Spyr1) TaxID=278137 RepID=E6TDY4_MYCSR|nr:YihY/virulence factor BrkB family protein [Mycolicibacterium gilvum]ADT99828.1 predicted membrane protein [Mycolicibacterium gilvum Spyr1]
MGALRPAAVAGAFAAGLATGVLTRSQRNTHAGQDELPESAASAAPEPAEAEKVDAPPADDPAKPESPTDLTRPSWLFVLRKTAREFTHDQCTDLAAALTYYAVLSLFPALVVVMSLLGVIGQSERTADAVLGIVDDVSPGAAVDVLREPIQQLVNAPSAGLTLVLGIVGALWSASGFVGAFGRAMNRIYEVEEGRPGWKLRLQQLFLTLVGLIVAATAALLLAVSGPVAEAVGGYLGVGATGLTVWNITRWPLLLVLVVFGVAMLYYVSPNVRQPKFRWISVGAAIAIVTWVCASLGFGFYVANFGNYNKTFGTLAGVIVFLLWLWLTNLALLFGAEVDAELERGRQLQAGIRAEDTLKLPLRDTSLIEKNKAKEHETRLRGRVLRRSRGRHDGFGDDPQG